MKISSSSIAPALGVLAVVASLASACEDSAESPAGDDDAAAASAGNGGAGTGAGGATSSSGSGGSACDAALEGACGACMKGACCEALTACEDDPSCLACVTGADGEACEKTPETHARVNAYLTCKGGPCQGACVGARVGSCEGLLDEIAQPVCVTCLEDGCCDEVAACKTNATCWDGCLTNHDEAKCHGDPGGHALFHALGTCLQQNCETECAPSS